MAVATPSLEHHDRGGNLPSVKYDGEGKPLGVHLMELSFSVALTRLRCCDLDN